MAQWQMLPSPVKTDLLSVDARDSAVWVSGRNNVVLHSTNRGSTWDTCAGPAKNGATDIVSIAAFDATTATAVSGGRGEGSAVYRTADGCKTWKKVFDNPEETSSFNSLRRVTGQQVYLVGEPVKGKFPVYLSQDGGVTWFVTDDAGLDALAGETAAGSQLIASGPFLYFGTASKDGPRLHFTQAKCVAGNDNCAVEWVTSKLPFSGGAAHGIGTRMTTNMNGTSAVRVVAFATSATKAGAAVSPNGGVQWAAAGVLEEPANPVAMTFNVAKQKWIAIGTSGTVLSADNGLHWTKGPDFGTPSDSGWAALASPFVVGADGKIGMLDEAKVR